MSYGAGSSYQVDEDSSSSSSSSSDGNDYYDLELQQQNITFQTNVLITRQQNMTQRYYLSAQAQNPNSWGVSQPGHVVVNRGRQAAAMLLKNDYFVPNPTFENKFRRQFRMSRGLFLRIRRGLKDYSPLWKKKVDVAHVMGFTSYQKLCASIQFLAYGTGADSFDQYFRIDESTLLDYAKQFCHDIVAVFGSTYLRKPNANDIDHLLQVAEARGFPGMLGSLDCMHWKWRNYASRDAGAYRGRNKACTIILEAVASYDTWIWHAFFGLPGTNNDVNVLNKSNLFNDLANNTSLPANYSIKGRNYQVGYYLADGIYPKWSTLVQTIRIPQGQKEKYFVQKQEAYRKDVKRAFGVLQARSLLLEALVEFGANLPSLML